MDSTTREIFINDLFLMLRFIIPLSFTIYIFAYRERKEIAYSTLKRTNKFLNFIYITISIILIIAYIEYKYLKILEKVYESNIFSVTIIIITLIWLITLIILYIKILSSINLFIVSKKNFLLFEKRIKQLEKKLTKFKNKLQNVDVSFAHECTYYSSKIKKKLNLMLLHLEIVYQILISKLKYNLEIDFFDSNKNYNQQIIKYIRKLNNEFFEELVLVSHEDFLKIYSLILNKNLYLLRYSLSTSSTNDINLIIDFYKDLTPNKFQFKASKAIVDEIKKYNKYPEFLEQQSEKAELFLLEYYKYVYEMMTILESNRKMDLMKVLKIMYEQERQSNLHIKFMDLTALSLALMLYAIERNNIKFLTDLTNILLNSTLNDFIELNVNEQTNINFNGYKINQKFIDNPIEDYDKKIETITLMGILLIVKSIELGHYQCAGFLIKVLCKNIEPITINSILMSINEYLDQVEINSDIFQSEEINLKILEELNVDFYFSSVSLQYCFQKTVFLMLAQQHYLLSFNQINYKKGDIFDIRLLIFDYDFIKYLKLKVEGLDKEYGLAFLKNKEFLNDFISYMVEDEEKKKSPIQN